MKDKDIRRLSKQITTNPDLILEDVERDLGYFLSQANLSHKESAFYVGVNTEDDPGDYPNALAARPLRSHSYVEEIYGGAELKLSVAVEDIPPYVGWRIEFKNASIQRFKDEDGNIISARENRPIGILIFTDAKGDTVAATPEFMTEALDMELYLIRDELEIDIPLDQVTMPWHLEVTWANWEFKEGRLECTLGVMAVIE